MFSEEPSSFVFLFVMVSSEFVAARSSNANVSAQVMTSQDLVKVEFVRT